MATPFKMKGSPLYGYGNQSPLKKDPYKHLSWESKHKAKMQKLSNINATNKANKQKIVNEVNVFGPKKSTENKSDALQKVANDILISNTPNPNRKSEYKAATTNMQNAGKAETSAKKYNKSRADYIKYAASISKGSSKTKGTLRGN